MSYALSRWKVWLAAAFVLAIAACAPEQKRETAKIDPFAAKIDAIRFKELNLSGANLGETVEILGIKMLFDDPEPDPTMRGIGMQINRPEERVSFSQIPPPKVGSSVPTPAKKERVFGTYRKTNVTLREVFQDIANTFDVDVCFTSADVVICDHGADPFPNFKGATGRVFSRITPVSNGR